MGRLKNPMILAWCLSMVGCTLGGVALAHVWQKPAQPAKAEPWLAGSTEQKLTQVEKHLRGLDQAMVEIGHRYGELIVASKTRNWEYAQYQTEKIDLSMRLALERRPKRAKSSQPFLTEDLPRVLEAVKKRDGDQLDVAMTRLHEGCVQCHKSEDVLYFKESVERIRAQSLQQASQGVKP